MKIVNLIGLRSTKETARHSLGARLAARMPRETPVLPFVGVCLLDASFIRIPARSLLENIGADIWPC